MDGEDKIFNAKSAKLKFEDGEVISHGHKFAAGTMSVGAGGVISAQDHKGKDTKIGIEIDGKKMEGFATLTKKVRVLYSVGYRLEVEVCYAVSIRVMTGKNEYVRGFSRQS